MVHKEDSFSEAGEKGCFHAPWASSCLWSHFLCLLLCPLPFLLFPECTVHSPLCFFSSRASQQSHNQPNARPPPLRGCLPGLTHTVAKILIGLPSPAGSVSGRENELPKIQSVDVIPFLKSLSGSPSPTTWSSASCRSLPPTLLDISASPKYFLSTVCSHSCSSLSLDCAPSHRVPFISVSPAHSPAD